VAQTLKILFLMLAFLLPIRVNKKAVQSSSADLRRLLFDGNQIIHESGCWIPSVSSSKSHQIREELERERQPQQIRLNELSRQKL